MEQKELSGVLVINKHAGVTSHDMVGRLRRVFGQKRIGHAGTLDPMATGVLVLLLGRAAKASEFAMCHNKRYRAVMRLGITTDTEDTSGKILTETNKIPDAAAVCQACAVFRGKIMQTPPMYSALKVDGKKLYELARSGVEIERRPREIEIFSLECTPTASPVEYLLDICCSSGTYVRTLCSDIGHALGCGAAMAGLVRTKSGDFDISDSHTLEEIEALGREGASELLVPVERLFSSLPAVTLEPFYENLMKNGCEIYLKKIGINLPLGSQARVFGASGNFVALAEVREYPDGRALKALRLFEIG